LPTHLPHKIEEKKKTLQAHRKYLEIYVFFSFLAIESWIFLGGEFLAPGDKRKGGYQDYKGFLLGKNGPKSPSFKERKGLESPTFRLEVVAHSSMLTKYNRAPKIFLHTLVPWPIRH
jgi:hypothetical protein